MDSERGRLYELVAHDRPALASFSVGIGLLLAVLNIIVWGFGGGRIALLLLIAILKNLVVVIYLQQNIDEISQHAEALDGAGFRASTSSSRSGHESPGESANRSSISRTE